MKVKTPETGEIVQSMQGRDKGGYYVVCKVEGNTLYLADGRARKLANPKKKNVRHVRLLPQSAIKSGIKYPWDKAFDCNVAYLIKTLNKQSDQS